MDAILPFTFSVATFCPAASEIIMGLIFKSPPKNALVGATLPALFK